jgi:4-amino-4-deoxy-L-arabinose transferase-like glycosyltransferase
MLPSLGAAPLDRAEIYFMDAARSMLETGDWLVPRYRGAPFFDKPALTYWLLAASFRLGGFTAEAARAVSALAALATLAATLWLGAALFDRRTGLAAAAILATTAAFVSFARLAMSDMLVALWSTLALAVFVSASRRTPPADAAARSSAPAGAAPAWAWPALGAVLGLALQTKGPIAVAFPLVAIALLGPALPVRPRAAPLPLALGALAFVLLGLGWFALVFRRLGLEPLRYFFLRENLERFAGDAYDAGRPAWFYAGSYLAAGLPWSLLLPAALLGALRRGAGAPLERRLLAWTAAMAALLSLSRGKVDYYLLPLYPATALVIGRQLVARDWRSLDRAALRAGLIIAALALALLPWAAARLPQGWVPGAGARLAFDLLSLLGALGVSAAALRPSPRRVLAALALSAAGLGALVVNAFLPAIRAGQPNARLLADVEREHRYRPDARVAACRDVARLQRDLLFHARLVLEERCDLWSAAGGRAPYLMLLQPHEHAALANVPGLRVVSREMSLAAADFTLGGLLAGPRPEPVILAANYVTSDPVAETRRRRERKKALRVEFPEPAGEPEPKP